MKVGHTAWFVKDCIWSFSITEIHACMKNVQVLIDVDRPNQEHLCSLIARELFFIPT